MKSKSIGYFILAMSISLFFISGCKKNPTEEQGPLRIYTILISGGNLFVGTSNGIYVSTDNGTNWSQGGLPEIFITTFSTGLNGWIFAGAYLDGMYRSTNNGSSWQGINDGLTYTDVRSSVTNASGYIFAGTTGAGVFRTNNSGANWYQVGLVGDQINSLLSLSGNRLFAGSYSGVSLSTDDGNNWAPRINGLSNVLVLSMDSNSNGVLFAGTSGGGVFRSTDNASSWVQTNSGLTDLEILSMAINSSDTLFVGTRMGGVLRSTNNGDTWVPMIQGMSDRTIFCLGINSNDHIFAGTDGSIYRSTDLGSNWEKITAGLIQ